MLSLAQMCLCRSYMNWRRKRKPFWMKEVFANIDFIFDFFFFPFPNQVIFIASELLNASNSFIFCSLVGWGGELCINRSGGNNGILYLVWWHVYSYWMDMLFSKCYALCAWVEFLLHAKGYLKKPWMKVVKMWFSCSLVLIVSFRL